MSKLLKWLFEHISLFSSVDFEQVVACRGRIGQFIQSTAMLKQEFLNLSNPHDAPARKMKNITIS